MQANAKIIKIGTRGSPLALAQANDVRARMLAAHDDLVADQVEIVIIKTSGDRILDRHLLLAGGKGLFTKEIEDALLAGEIDLAVHSSKDMPTELPDGLVLSTFLPREDVRDVFISPVAGSLNGLPEGSTLGTASLRRRAQALRKRPDLKVVTFRGNVQTRLKKLKAGTAGATFLALAGLKRLDMADAATDILPLDDFLPAPAQGAVAVEVRDNDTAIKARLAPLHCDDTADAVLAERAYLAALDGSCRTPIAAHATLDGDQLTLKAELYSLDGSDVFATVKTGDRSEKIAIGREAGLEIRDQAGENFFQSLFQQVQETIEEQE